jgi:hypothetical protein
MGLSPWADLDDSIPLRIQFVSQNGSFSLEKERANVLELSCGGDGNFDPKEIFGGLACLPLNLEVIGEHSAGFGGGPRWGGASGEEEG